MTSSRFASVATFLTISVSAVSETLLNEPSTVLPLLNFTESLLPLATEVSRDQSFVCAATITGESRIEVSRITTVANCVVLLRIVSPHRVSVVRICGVDEGYVTRWTDAVARVLRYGSELEPRDCPSGAGAPADRPARNKTERVKTRTSNGGPRSSVI